MRILSTAVSLILINLCAAQDLTINNARIIDGAGNTIENGFVVVRDGKIVSVASGLAAQAASIQIDAQGMTVMPGLINTHWHLMVGSPATSDEAANQYVEDVVTKELDALLDRGVTTIMSQGDHFPIIIDVRRRVVEGELRGPRLRIVGPVLSASDDWPTQICGGNPYCRENLTAELDDAGEARAKVREIAATGVDALKLVYDDQIAPDVRVKDEVVAAIAHEAKKNDLVLYAHVSTKEETGLGVVKLGVGGLVHPVSFRTEVNKKAADVLRDLEVPVSTTISGKTREWFDLRGRKYSVQNEEQFANSLQDLKHLWDAGVVVAFGTDTVADQESVAAKQFMAEARGLNQAFSNEEVVTMLTRNAALFIGMGDEIGTLEAGKLADIILVNGDPLADIGTLANVEVVIQGGRVVFEKR